MATEHEGHTTLTEKAKFVVEEDKMLCGNFTEDEEFEEEGSYDFVVVHEECSKAGWSYEDVVCRCTTRDEATAIAKLLTEHGFTKSQR